MSEIKLNDLLGLTEEEISNSKITLNIHNTAGGLCIDSWLKSKNTDAGFWSRSGKRRNFQVGQYGFAFYKLSSGGDKYLFVGAGRITKIAPIENPGPAEYEPIERFQNYAGRLIIDVYKGNTNQGYCFTLGKFLDRCTVSEILPEEYGGEAFPGFDKLILSYDQLYRGIYINTAWRDILRKQKGVYAIVDKAPESEYSGLGRIYIGSATSDSGMLWDRWKNYADSLSGGNKELERVKKLKGEEYLKKYFQWSLLEHFDEHIDDRTILGREKHWKLVFNTKDQGLNDNL